MITETKAAWQLAGATRDAQSVTADWMPASAPVIPDVTILESRWVIKGNGRLVELYRRDWFEGHGHLDQVFHVVLNSRSVSAWHVHEHTTDRLTVSAGHIRLVLYDTRSESPSYGRVMEVLADAHRPQLIIVPPRIWHGVENAGDEPAVIVNMPDRAYQYASPDHWRLPADTDAIPFRFRYASSSGSGI